jgi:hypothetical protein
MVQREVAVEGKMESKPYLLWAVPWDIAFTKLAFKESSQTALLEK